MNSEMTHMAGTDAHNFSGRPLDRVAIVVVNYGSHQLLSDNLATPDILSSGCTVVVVDNFHSEAERSAITELGMQNGWTVLTQSENLGFGAAMNLGISVAIKSDCDALLLLNPDARIDVPSILALVEDCRYEPRTMLCPRILRADGTVWFRGGTLDMKTGHLAGVKPGNLQSSDHWLTGACIMVSDVMWMELKGFDESYFLYWEDVDLTRRCVGIGGALKVRDDLTATHSVGGTQTEHGKSSTYYYYNCRNRLLFACKHLPLSLMLMWLLRTPFESTAILLRGGRRQFISSPALLAAGVAGSVVGIGLVVKEIVERFGNTVQSMFVDRRSREMK